MNKMFYYCKQLTFIDLFPCNQEKIIDKSSLFNHCFNIKNLEISPFKNKNNEKYNSKDNDNSETHQSDESNSLMSSLFNSINEIFQGNTKNEDGINEINKGMKSSENRRKSRSGVWKTRRQG